MTNASTVRMILTSSAKALGVPLPTTLTDALGEAAELLGRSRELSAERTTSALVEAVLNELRNGADPLDSSEVQRAALGHQVASAGVVGAVAALSDDMITTALVEATDEILSDWSASLSEHSENLTSAAAKLGTDDLHDLPGIQRAPVAYSLAVEALRRFDAAVQGAQQLAALSRVSVPDVTLYFLPDPARLPELMQAAALRSESRPSPWILARHSVAPRLVSSLGELMERSAMQREQRAAADVEREQKESRAAKARV